MLIFTLDMHGFSTLVYITVISIQCQAITVRDDDYNATPKTYTYSDPEQAKSEVSYRQEDYYKSLRRADIPTFEYRSEEDYTQQQPDQEPENNPFEQRIQRQQIGRRRTPVKKQYVEQYLKEVTPTTKTAYNQRSGNYLRLNSQPRDRGIKEAEELQRSILKQPSIQYIVQSDLQQKPHANQQIQYVIPQQKTTQNPPRDQQPHSATLTAYQNALLAHQKVLETEGQDGSFSRSSIYVSHSIPKKPVRKFVKPAPRDEDAEQYTQLQQYELQQKQPVIYQRQQQPAEVVYQTKLQYSNEDTEVTASTELPSFQHERELSKYRQRLKVVPQYQQVSTGVSEQEQKFVYQHPQQLEYQQILSNIQAKIPQSLKLKQRPQISAERQLEYKTVPRVADPYQQPIYVKKGPKYLPEPKAPRYQPSIEDEGEEKYQQVVNVSEQQPEALITFEAALAKLQSEKLRQQRLRAQTTYQGQDAETGGYTLLSGETQDPKTPEVGYVRIEEANKYHPVESTESPSQTQQLPNIRYYRHPRKPTDSYSQEQ